MSDDAHFQNCLEIGRPFEEATLAYLRRIYPEPDYYVFDNRKRHRTPDGKKNPDFMVVDYMGSRLFFEAKVRQNNSYTGFDAHVGIDAKMHRHYTEVGKLYEAPVILLFESKGVVYKVNMMAREPDLWLTYRNQYGVTPAAKWYLTNLEVVREFQEKEDEA